MSNTIKKQSDDLYQQTELGILPRDWQIKKIGELFDVQQGVSMSQARRDGPNKHPFLRTLNVLWNGVDLSTLDFMDFSEKEIERLKLKPGDLLVCEGGDIGRTTIWRGELRSCVYQNHIHRLRAKNAEVYPEYVMFWMQAAIKILGHYSDEGNRTTIPNLSQSRLKNFSIPLPPLPEQHAIAHILRTVQEAKEKTDAVIAATKALKASMMKHLFTYGPVSLEDAGNVALKETEIGQVPEAWEIRQLSSLFDIKHGYSFKSEFFGSTGKFILLTPGHFHEEGGFKDLKEKTKFYTIEPPHDLVLTKGDLLVAMTEQSPGLLGSPIFIPESDKYLHNQRLGLIRNLDTTNLIPEYLFHFFNLEKVRTIISITSTGTKVKHTSPNKIRAIPISLPTIDEQKKIVTILFSIDQKLTAEQSRKEALDTLFTSLLHDLMTTKIRVAPAETA